MSYEVISAKEVPCQCGAGKIVTEFLMNDWGQTKERTVIQCEKCRTSHKSTATQHEKSGQYESYQSLIARVSGSVGINIYTTPLEEQYCIQYSYETLHKISEALSRATTYAALTDEDARKAVRMCKASCKTQRISFVRDKVVIALQIYETFKNNLDNERKPGVEYNATECGIKKDIPKDDDIVIGKRYGCFTVVAGCDAYQEEVAKQRIEKLEEDKRKFINGEKVNCNFEKVETFDRWIERERNAQKYKIQCKCGKFHFCTSENLLGKRWRYCSEDCGIKLKKEAEWYAAYPRVKSDSYDIEFINNTHESLQILECIDDHVEGNAIVQDKRKKGAGAVYLYKKFRCKCTLCGREYEFLSSDFAIRNDAYGSRATWGYYCEAFCGCHAISSFQWRTISIFHDYRIPYRAEVSFSDLLSEKGNPLRYDFAILNSDNSIKCLVECQGKEHFQIGGGFGGYSALNTRQARDEKKREYARTHNIPLCEIHYKYDTYDKEVKFLKEQGIIDKEARVD